MTFGEILSKIQGVEKTFVGWMVKEYKILYEKEPEIEAVVDTAIDYVSPALVIVLDAAGGAAIAPEVASVIAEVQADLKVVSALIYDFGATPTAAKIAAAVQANLQGLLTAGHVKDAALQAKFGLIIKTVGVVATAIANAVAPLAPATA